MHWLRTGKNVADAVLVGALRRGLVARLERVRRQCNEPVEHASHGAAEQRRRRVELAIACSERPAPRSHVGVSLSEQDGIDDACRPYWTPARASSTHRQQSMRSCPAHHAAASRRCPGAHKGYGSLARIARLAGGSLKPASEPRSRGRTLYRPRMPASWNTFLATSTGPEYFLLLESCTWDRGMQEVKPGCSDCVSHRVSGMFSPLSSV